MGKQGGLTVEEILKRSLAREKASFSFYDRLLKSTTVDLIQDLLQELKNEEYRHIKMIEQRTRRLGTGQGVTYVGRSARAMVHLLNALAIRSFPVKELYRGGGSDEGGARTVAGPFRGAGVRTPHRIGSQKLCP